MAYFIISKFALSDFLRFGDNRVFLKIAERRGVIRIRIHIPKMRMRARRARITPIARVTASSTGTATIRVRGIRVKKVGKTSRRRTSYLCGHAAQSLVALALDISRHSRAFCHKYLVCYGVRVIVGVHACADIYRHFLLTCVHDKSSY